MGSDFFMYPPNDPRPPKKPIVDIETETVVEARHTVSLTGPKIARLLRAAGVDVPLSGFRVEFEVPSGGDYSGEKVELAESPSESDRLVTVSWTTRSGAKS